MSHSELKNIKIIVVSSEKGGYDKINSVTGGLSGLILKPLKFQDSNSRRILRSVADSLVGKN